MLDIWIGDGLLLLAIPFYMVFAIQRMRPRLLPGPGIVLEAAESLDSEYIKRYLGRLLLTRLAPVLLAGYFACRVVLWPSDVRAEGPSGISIVIVALATYIASLVGVSIVRIRQEQRFVTAHSEFQDSFPLPRARVFIILVWALSLGITIASSVIEDDGLKSAVLGLGIVVFLIGLQLRKRQAVRSRLEIPWDEPLGLRIAEVVDLFGIKPKKLVLTPSLLANAWALPDGSVIVTTAFRTLATHAEVAAIVAHELSHVRDGEGKKYVRFRLLSTLPLVALAGFALGFGQSMAVEAFLPPLIGFGIMSLSMVSAWWLSRRTRPMEFKCDADAAKVGLGPELASGLDKLTRFMGQPSDWIGIDRFLTTHPSLKERRARLIDASRSVSE